MVKPQPKSRNARGFWALLAVVFVVGAGALAWLTTQRAETVITMDPGLAPVAAEGYRLGRPDAPVEIIEFADYECPVCSQYAMVTEPDVRARLVETGLARITYFDFPLDMHRNTWGASMAAACANDQNRFWEMHDRLYAGQLEWNTQATATPKGVFRGYAKELGLDVAAWEACYDARKHLARIQASRAEAERRRFTGTPAFIIGDKVIPGKPEYDLVKALVDSALARQKAVSPPATRTVP